jgi:hypothetical protein
MRRKTAALIQASLGSTIGEMAKSSDLAAALVGGALSTAAGLTLAALIGKAARAEKSYRQKRSVKMKRKTAALIQASLGGVIEEMLKHAQTPAQQAFAQSPISKMVSAAKPMLGKKMPAPGSNPQASAVAQRSFGKPKPVAPAAATAAQK